MYIPIAYLYILLHLWHGLRISSKENSVALWNTKSLLLQSPSLLSAFPWTSRCMGKCGPRGTHMHTSNRRKRATGSLTVAQHDQACTMGPKQTWGPSQSFLPWKSVSLLWRNELMECYWLEKGRGLPAWGHIHTPHSERHQSMLWPYLIYSLRASFRNSTMSIRVIF